MRTARRATSLKSDFLIPASDTSPGFHRAVCVCGNQCTCEATHREEDSCVCGVQDAAATDEQTNREILIPLQMGQTGSWPSVRDAGSQHGRSTEAFVLADANCVRKRSGLRPVLLPLEMRDFWVPFPPFPSVFVPTAVIARRVITVLHCSKSEGCPSPKRQRLSQQSVLELASAPPSTPPPMRPWEMPATRRSHPLYPPERCRRRYFPSCVCW
ncbi:hypothetical protein Z043_108190 [Scleropages formosus]|uniref:Uncharacterized protein n=1 Tax=Scleropages formosus TaxID=113540 RepID=A0A0N8K0Q3_SCLFO|nr:hypothetical protein Z043_108190 [Scleropages formosus]